MRFYGELYYWFLLLIPIIVILTLIVYNLRKNRIKTFADNNKAIDRLLINFSERKYKIKLLLIIFVFIFAVIAIIRPQFGSKVENIERKGIDIVIAIDTSLSMKATDIKPNRLEKAKHQLIKYIDNYLKGDRIGIVPFAGDAFIHCPLTLDYDAAKMLVKTIDTNMLPTQGTALGTAIKVAKLAFPSSSLKHKVLILLTDGEDHNTNPIKEAETAAEQGLKIYTIGIGTPSGVPIPVGNKEFQKDKEGNLVMTKLDEETLKKIALITGGAYFRATGGESELNIIFNEINKIEKSKFATKKFVTMEDRYQFFLVIAVLLLLIETFLNTRAKRKVR